MQEIKVELLHHTPLWVAARAIRTAWASHGKSDSKLKEVCEVCGSTNVGSMGRDTYDAFYYCKKCGHEDFLPITKVVTGEADKELIARVGNKFKHGSTLEHLVYTFDIRDFSRAVLQELSRHRLASPTVKSTRYTLSELKNEREFIFGLGDESWDSVLARAKKYIRLTGDEFIDKMQIKQLEILRETVAYKKGKSNDLTKYTLPECYLTQEVLTINARSLQNLLSLRSDKSALWEIRELARCLFNALPDEHKYLFEEFMKDE